MRKVDINYALTLDMKKSTISSSSQYPDRKLQAIATVWMLLFLVFTFGWDG